VTKREFVDVVQAAMGGGGSKKAAEDAIDAVFASTKDVLVAGKAVHIPQFGGFERVKREAREGRNPHSGEKIAIPAKFAVTFKAAQALKDAVNP
jgi:DNA-binding protein HU-beta